MQRLYLKNRFQNKTEKTNSSEMDHNNRFMTNTFTVNQLTKLKTTILRKFLLLFSAFLLFQSIVFSQAHLELTVQDGSVTTTCTDAFGSPDPRFSVNVNGTPWVTYPATPFCFTDFPNMQFEAFYDCPSDVPLFINVCFRVFEDDGTFCNLDEQCMVELCQDYLAPAPGTSIDYNVQIADGQASDGELNFTIALDNNFIGGANDLICDAVDLGSLPFQGTIGNPALSNYNNFCATNVGDPNPTSEGGVFGNDRGVWYSFMTGANPSAYNYVNAFSDPEGLGDDIGLQLALYQSNDGTCNNISLVYSAYDNSSLDQSLIIPCLEPNTQYYILVDAAFLPGTGVGLEGYFGLQVIGAGIIESADFRCSAEDLGLVPDGGSVGTPLNQTNYCATDIGEPNPTAFVLQKAVWFMFQAPVSGHVIIDAVSDQDVPFGIDAVDTQIALYRSGSNACIGPMIEVESQYSSVSYDESLEVQCLVPGNNYWVVIDGSGNNTEGIFSITISDGGPVGPQSTTVLDEIVCDGGSLQVGDSLYTVSGSIEELVLADNGCDSLIIGTVTILDPISTVVDTAICSGESVTVGNSVYYVSGNYTDVLTSFQFCDSTVYTNVTVLENVEAVAFQVQEASDINASDGSATVTVTGGIAPYTYLWSNGATTQTINNLSPGLYCVTVTADNGCEDVTCISVLYPGAISVNVQNGEVTCNGDSDGVLTITVTDGTPVYNYEWGIDFGAAQGSGMILNAGQSSTISNLAPGSNYTITVTDGDGLIVVSFGEIVEPLPIVNNLDTTICFGETLIVGSTTYDTSGPILENLTSPDGCDSLVTGTLVILNEISTDLNNLTECFGGSVTVGNQVYNSTGPINEVIQATNGCDSTVTGFLTVLPEIATTLDSTVCFGESIIVGNSTYSTSGVFTDILPADNGCDSTITTNLTVLAELTVSVALVAEASGLGDADGIAQANPVGGSGNYTFEWSNSATGNIVSNLTGGQTYCVTVTDDNDCTAENCVVILFPVDIQSAFQNDTLDCPGDTNGVLSFSAANGQAPYTYTWQNADNSLNGNGNILTEGGMATVNNLPSGIYTIEIADQWGSGIFTIEIVEATPMAFNLINQLDASCFGECNGVLEIEILNGTPPFTTQFPGITGNPVLLENLCAGDYEVIIADANGCTATWNGQVSQPAAFIVEVFETNPVSCNGGSDGIASLVTNGNPIDILWNNGGDTDEIGDLLAGTYSVTVTNSDNCTAEASIDITEPPTAITALVTLDQEISCNGEADAAISVTASGGTGYTYSWSNGMTESSLDNLGPGTYTVTILDDNGCDAFDGITIIEPTSIDPVFSTIDVNCLDGENSGVILIDTVIGGAGGYVYSIDGLIYFTLSEFNGLGAGDYNVYVQDANGCIEVFQVPIASPGEIEVSLGDDQTILLGESINLEAITTSGNPIFEWSVDSLTCLSCTEIQVNPVEASMYSVMVTDTLTGCTARDEIIVQVSKKRDVFIPNVFSPNFDGDNDVFRIYSGPSVARINSFIIFDRWGGKVFEANNVLPNDDIGWDGTVKGKDVAVGVYIYLADIEYVDGFQRMYRGDVTVVK
jgi:gliding motility-associated-like protein